MLAIGRAKRAAATGTAAVVALVGLVTTSHVAQAGGIGPSVACNDGVGGDAIEKQVVVPLPGGGATLSFEVGDGGPEYQLLPNLENIHVGVCFSDTPPGTPSNLAGGWVAVFGPQLGAGSPNPLFLAYCENDANVVIQPQCGVGLDAVITPAVGTCGIACGATVTVTVPVVVCAGLDIGVHAVGFQCPSGAVGTSPGLGATGLVITSFGVGGGPNGSTGIVSTLVVNGVPLLPLIVGV